MHTATAWVAWERPARPLRRHGLHITFSHVICIVGSFRGPAGPLPRYLGPPRRTRTTRANGAKTARKHTVSIVVSFVRKCGGRRGAYTSGMAACVLGAGTAAAGAAAEAAALICTEQYTNKYKYSWLRAAAFSVRNNCAKENRTTKQQRRRPAPRPGGKPRNENTTKQQLRGHVQEFVWWFSMIRFG